MHEAQKTASSSLLTPQFEQSFTFSCPDDFLRCAQMALCVIIHYDQGRRRSRFTRGATSTPVREAAVSETICPDCGERNARGAEFCGACGAFLAWDGQQADPESARPAPPTPPTAQHRPPAAAPGPAPAAPPRGEQPRPTAPVVAAAGGVAAQASNQVAGQAAAQAWNVATPVLGTQLPGALGQGARALGVPTTLGGVAQGALAQGLPWRGAGSSDAPPQQAQAPGYQTPPQAPPEPPPPTEGPCPRCGVVNGAELRFCRKCGLALRGPTLHDGGAPRLTAPPERAPWWRRWFRPADNTRRGARAAYRRSLPVRYRIIRWGLALLGIGAIIGAFALIGRNPVGWAVNTWNDVLGKTVQVNNLDAYTDPNPAEAAGNPGTVTASPGATPSLSRPAVDTAPNVVDNLSNTAWMTAWSQTSQLNPADAPCVPPSTPTAADGPESILIVPQGSITVRAISVAGGLSKDDARRQQQWRPKTVQLAFSDGSCQQVTLADNPDLQSLELNAVDTTQIRLSVIDAYSASPDQPIDEVAITDIRIFTRP